MQPNGCMLRLLHVHLSAGPTVAGVGVWWCFWPMECILQRQSCCGGAGPCSAASVSTRLTTGVVRGASFGSLTAAAAVRRQGAAARLLQCSAADDFDGWGP